MTFKDPWTPDLYLLYSCICYLKNKPSHCLDFLICRREDGVIISENPSSLVTATVLSTASLSIDPKGPSQFFSWLLPDLCVRLVIVLLFPDSLSSSGFPDKGLSSVSLSAPLMLLHGLLLCCLSLTWGFLFSSLSRCILIPHCHSPLRLPYPLDVSVRTLSLERYRKLNPT